MLAPMREWSNRQVSAQATILASAVAVWALVDRPTWLVLVGAYLLAWVSVGLLGLRLARWSFALLVVVGLTWVVARGDALLDGEAVRGTAHHLQDRWRLENVPSIAPATVRADRPQRFVVHAPGASEVRVRLGPRGRTLEAEPLGHGVFRVGYDPRTDGRAADGEETRARIVVDGRAHERVLEHVVPTPHPRWFCRSPDGTLAATPSEETDELIVVQSDGSLQRIDVGDGPSDCVFTSPSRVLVAHRWGPSLWLIDLPRARVLRRIPIASAHRLAIDESRVAVALRDRVVLLDRAWREIARLNLRADWIALVDDALVASSLRPAALHRAREVDEWVLSAPLPLGRPAVTMSVAPGGVVLATTDYRPDGRPHGGNHYVQDQLLHVDVDTWEVTRQTLTARRSARQGSAGNVDRGASPMGIEALPDGSMRVAFAGTDEAWRIAGDAEPTMELLDVPAPHGIVSFASGSWSVSSPSAGVIATRTSDGWRLEALDDLGTHARRRGEHDFYEATRSGVSCQSCHLHGHTDFVMRNIGGRRLAPTLSVLGVAATSPYLRDASYPRIADLDHLSQTLLRGFLRPARRGADLEAWIRSLARVQPVANEDVERERRGLDAFVHARCPTCHAFPAFTNLAQIPLGALFPERLEAMGADEVLDVPSLLSVSTHGPYLSDGRAESVLEVLRDHNGANRHGDTDALSDDELADLVYFLEGL